MELDQELIIQVIAALAALGGGALAVVLVPLAVKHAAKYTREAAYYVRRYQPQVIEAVDEPTDAIPMRIDALLDRVYPADWNHYAAAALPAFYRALADALEAGAGLPARAPQSQPQETLRSE